MVATATGVALDVPAPNFRLPATDGKTYALEDVAGPNGTVICNPAANPDTGCVPMNIFSAATISPAAINFLSIQSYNNTNISERVASLAFTGKLGDYGIKSAWANDGVGVAFGSEYRREHLDTVADFLANNGLVNGNGGANPPVTSFARTCHRPKASSARKPATSMKDKLILPSDSARLAS